MIRAEQLDFETLYLFGALGVVAIHCQTQPLVRVKLNSFEGDVSTECSLAHSKETTHTVLHGLREVQGRKHNVWLRQNDGAEIPHARLSAPSLN